MSDPQRCEGGPSAVLLVNAWMKPCQCGHPMIEHELADPRTKRKGIRTECMTTEGTKKCPCVLYSAGEAI